MATKIWNGGSDNWATPGDWSPNGDPGAGNAVDITSGDPQITSNVGTVASVFDSAQGAMTDGQLTVSGAFTLEQGGDWQLDTASGTGGSTLSTGGALSNAGIITVGPDNETLAAASTIKAAKVLNVIGEALGQINLFGSAATLAKLDITGAAGFGAAGTVYGAVNLSYDALVEFGKGQITTIATNSALTLSGPTAFVADAGHTGSNSALTGLTSIYGQFYLGNGASVTTTSTLTNSGQIYLDTSSSNGGSSLTIDKALNNSGTIVVGPDNNTLAAASTIKVASVANFVGETLGAINLFGSSSILAKLDVGAPAGFGAARTLFGNVNLDYDALVEFTKGEITKIAASSELTLTGSKAFVADASNLKANSALTGLTTIDGGLNISDGASITTSGSLANAGQLYLDSPSGSGGARLTVHGKLTNTGVIDIGPDNNTLSSASTMRVASLANFVGQSYGTIDLFGDDNPQAPKPIPASIVVSSVAGFGAAGVLKGMVYLTYDAAIVFKSGEIKTIAAQSELSLTNAGSVIADAGKTSSDSALTGLKTVDGTLSINDGATVTTGGSLTNAGVTELDTPSGAGGARLTVHGKLSNSGTLDIGPDNNTLSSASTIHAANLSNFIGKTLGTINLFGDDNPQAPKPEPATLDIAAAAGFGSVGVLTGSVNLTYDAILEFKSGQIATIAAASELSLTDADAVVADASSHGSNSALKGLKTIDGSLFLNDGASVTTSDALVNAGAIGVDELSGAGHSVLRVDERLTNAATGTLTIGPDNQTLSATSTVAAKWFTNHGTVDLWGSAVFHASLAVSGAVTNDGTINVTFDVESLAGAIGGAGQFNLSDGATLDLGSSVASGETIAFSGADTLKLGDAAKFAAAISGFMTVGDEVVASGFKGASMSFSEHNSVATVTLSDHGDVAKLHFDGGFVKSDFHFNAATSTLSFV